MAGDLVFVTGSNGYVGFATLLALLQAGYRVRAAVRSQEKADAMLNNSYLKPLLKSDDTLTFAIVKDLVAPGAYDNAMASAKYVVHLATPSPGGYPESQFQSALIDPALKGTLNILTAASKTPSINHVVLTSSVAALSTFDEIFVQDAGKVFSETSRAPDSLAQPPYPNEIAAYAASKILPLNASERFMAETKPHFTLTSIMAPFVIGHDRTVTVAEKVVSGSNINVMLPLLGGELPPLGGSTVHVDDMARAHVRALDEDMRGVSSLIVACGGQDGIKYEDQIEVVNRLFPKAVANGVLKNEKAAQTKGLFVDSSESRKVLGWELKGFEKQVEDLVGGYLDLLGVERA